MNRLAYISSASHSGSTLLAMLLGAHPDACTVGELKADHLGDPERYRCSCGAPIGRCPFWRRVSAGMRERGFAYTPSASGTNHLECGSRYAQRLLAPLHRGPLLEAVRDAALALSPVWRRHLTEAQRRNAALVDVVRSLTGASVVVDSSKIGLRLKYLLRNTALDVVVIRLIRDGRGVSLTYMDPLAFADARDPSRRAGGSGGTRDAERKSMAAAAREWRRSNEEADAILARVPRARWTQTRYEDLCRDPAGELARLFTFLGLDPARRIADFRSVEQHVIGNGMRLDRTSEIALDERWRTHLTSAQLDEFGDVAGALNRRYGYEESTGCG